MNYGTGLSGAEEGRDDSYIAYTHLSLQLGTAFLNNARDM